MVYMARVLVVGAGVAGCTVAYTLAQRGVEVTLLEKSPAIGGKARTYGCKAISSKCQNCGACLTTGLWQKVQSHKNIRTQATQGDGSPVSHPRHCGQGPQSRRDGGYDAVVISTGFETSPGGLSAHLHIEGAGDCADGKGSGIISGTQLEQLMLARTSTDLFENEPRSVAFIQCLGSRDKNEGGLYCSRVCCSYSTRAAKVIRSYYPECEIVFFYMELQNVEAGNFYAGLREQGIEFINCRPLRVTGREPVTIEYDDCAKTQGDGSPVSVHGNTGEPSPCVKSREFDLVVLSDGIHAAYDNNKIAEIYGLNQDKDGFLHPADSTSGIYVAGCAKAPMKIDEAYADALAVAGKILIDITRRSDKTAEPLDDSATYTLHRR